MNCSKCEKMSPCIIPDTASESSDIEEEEIIPATVGPVRVVREEYLGIGVKNILNVSKIKPSRKGPIRLGSNIYLGIPLKDKRKEDKDDNIMQAPGCSRALFSRSPAQKRKAEEMLLESPAVSSTPYFSASFSTPMVGVDASPAAARMSRSPLPTGLRGRKVGRLGINGPLVLSGFGMMGIRRLPSFNNNMEMDIERAEGKELHGQGEYEEPEDRKINSR